MGAGILPTTIHNGKLYFLFGKENKYCDSPGWSDFGGGRDDNETFYQTALRESTEELTGFLGDQHDIQKLLSRGTYIIDNEKYRMFIFHLDYDPKLPYYYNNNQRFLQKHLDQNVIKKSKIFEKQEIKWICIDDILKIKKQFRSYFQNIIETIDREKEEIYKFIEKTKAFKKTTRKYTRKNRKN
jgi:8-oxo-dGTP pyrophosphatase MutT (NUDIX family)